MIGIIYKITNLLNNKLYIGQTTQELKKRWNDHKKRGAKSCPALKAAIGKYGKENFKIEEIDNASTIEELNIKEEYWIKFYNTIAPNGYNLTSGGNSKLATEETKRKMSQNYEDNIELWEKVSEASKKNWRNPVYRKNISEKRQKTWKNKQYRKKMSKLRKLSHKNNPNMENARNALRKLAETRKKPIYMCDLNNNILKEYNSTTDAIYENSHLKLQQSQISACCRGIAKTHRKLKWRFKND